MRLMLKFTIPVAKGNQAAKDGSLAKAMAALVQQAKPEASYFTLVDGERAGMIFFDASDSSLLPKLNEPLFAALEARVEIVPVLTADDLQRGLAA